MTTDSPSPPSRIERVLATMIAGVIGLSVLAFFAIIIATWSGFDRTDFGAGLWPIITMIPLMGLPLGFVLIIALLVVSTRRRRQGWAPGEQG
jgi:hypothetical protein